MAVSEMTPGGMWFRQGDNPPLYVVHASHIKRLTLEGWQPCADPRPELEAKRAAERAIEEQVQRTKEQEAQDKENALLEKIAKLEAALAKVAGEADAKVTPVKKGKD